MPDPSTYVRRSTALPAMQFTGDTASATAIADWLNASDANEHVFREYEPSSSNDQHPDLVLRIGDARDTEHRMIRNTDWVVLDHTMVLVYDADLFETAFEPTTAPV